jgi:aminopeptidase N
MRQLEELVGADAFREGLRDYLHRFQFGNAEWTDLVRILDDRSPADLAAWSRAWVDEPGRPQIRTDLIRRPDGTLDRLALVQSDPMGRGLIWPQRLQVAVGVSNSTRIIPVLSDGPITRVDGLEGQAPAYVLANGGGRGYGLFEPDEATRRYLLEHLPELGDVLVRGGAWLTLWDGMLERQIRPGELVDLALRALPLEPDEQNAELILGDLGATYWRFLAPDERSAAGPRIEAALRQGIDRARTPSLKAAYFNTFRSVAETPGSVEFVTCVWRKACTIPGLTLAERDFTVMAEELALREVRGWPGILDEQLARIDNPDRKARFKFVMPALSSDQAVRDSFFSSLRSLENRRHEPWVLEGLSCLHHPLRAAASRTYVRPSLEMLQELQRTGDIFFPKRWLDVTLSGHTSEEVAGTVRRFLDDNPDYPVRLRRIILQSADPLFRAAQIVDMHPGTR